MDNEISTSVVIAIELLVLSSVIGMVLLFAGIGQQFQRSTVASVTDVVASAYGSEIKALEEYEGDIPVATVYLVLERNEDLIELVNGSIEGTTITSKENLTDYFSERVTVTITQTPRDMFIVTIGG